MEKLVLRGIMYGADRIPDSWFEKVPGGFYKEKERNRKQHEIDEKRRSQSHRRDRSRRRRHSDEYEDRRRSHNEDADHEDRTERRRRHERSRSSYDGGADYDSEETERERRHTRSRTHGDSDRYGYDDGFSRSNGARHSHAPDFSPTGSHRPSHYSDPNVKSASKRASVAAAAASAGTAAAFAHQAQRHNPVASPPVVPVAAPVPGSVPVSYVPYANIYGARAPYPRGAPNSFSPPSAASISPVQPSVVPGAPFFNPLGYSPVTSPVNARGFPDPNQPLQSNRRDSYVPSHSHSPSSDGGAAPPRRTRSERRPHHDYEKSRGSQRFVDPRAYGATLPPPPPGPPPRADPLFSSWQQISG
ncbi:hypothetical protein MBLNU13_g03903t1 [Cladosporium sp. NU13]